LDARIHRVNQIAERKQRDAQDGAQQIEIMANAILGSPTYSRKDMKRFEHVSKNNDDKRRCASNWKIEDILFLRSQMIAAPANTRHAGISATNGLSTASFIVFLCFSSGASRSRGYENGNVSVTVVPRPISL
jgi:hypothetical protein